MTSKVLRWKTDLNINNEEYIGNDLLAKKLSQKGYDALIKDYVYIYPDDVLKTFSYIPHAWEFLKGIGIDLGSGVGCISAATALKKEVKKIYSEEIAESVVRLCQPIVISKILKKQKNKVVSVIGDFDHLGLKSNSLDFALSWFSMHHSNNLVKTFKEAKRVIKPNGKIIIVDRAHNDNTPDSEIERMLNIVYNEQFIKDNFRPKGTILTRQENGEHEYRYREWREFVKKSGLKYLSEVILKTDSPENREHKNDCALTEIFLNYELGVFKNRAYAFVLSK